MVIGSCKLECDRSSHILLRRKLKRLTSGSYQQFKFSRVLFPRVNAVEYPPYLNSIQVRAHGLHNLIDRRAKVFSDYLICHRICL